MDDPIKRFLAKELILQKFSQKNFNIQNSFDSSRKLTKKL